MSGFLKVETETLYRAVLRSIPTEPTTGGKYGNQWGYEITVNGEDIAWTPGNGPHDLMKLAGVQVGQEFTIERRRVGDKFPYFINELTYGDAPKQTATTQTTPTNDLAAPVLEGLLKDIKSSAEAALRLIPTEPPVAAAPKNDELPF